MALNGWRVVPAIPRSIARTEGAPDGGIPALTLAVTDDHGHTYVGELAGGGSRPQQWRLSYCFWPALDLAATALKITLVEKRWQHSSGDLADAVVGGPWELTVMLPPETPDA